MCPLKSLGIIFTNISHKLCSKCCFTYLIIPGSLWCWGANHTKRVGFQTSEWRPDRKSSNIWTHFRWCFLGKRHSTSRSCVILYIIYISNLPLIKSSTLQGIDAFYNYSFIGVGIPIYLLIFLESSSHHPWTVDLELRSISI